jgi:Chaperone of endosialidase
MPQGATVIVKSQRVVVNPTTRQVAVILAGPQGPVGPPGPIGPPGPGTPSQYVKADGSVPMTGALHAPELWLPNGAVDSRLTSLEASAIRADGSKTMTGPLDINVPTGHNIRLRSSTDLPYIGWWTADAATRMAYMQAAAGSLRIASDDAARPIFFRVAGADQMTVKPTSIDINSPVAPAAAVPLMFVGNRTYQMLGLYGGSYGIGVQGSCLYFRTGGTVHDFAWFGGGVHSDTNEDPGAGGREMMALRPDGLYLPDPNVQNMVVGASASSGARLRLHVPSSGNICYIDFAGNGAAGTESLYFRAGTVNVLQLEDTVVRSLKPLYTTGQLRNFYTAGNPALLLAAATAGATCYIALYTEATTTESLGTRTAYMGMNASDLYINNETGVNTRILSGSGVVILGIGSTERCRVETGGSFALGRTTTNYATDAGFDIRPDGRFINTVDTLSAYNWMINIGAKDVAGAIFVTFRRSTTPAQIGTITQVATTGVAYNTTSHGPHKHVLYELDDDEAIARVERWRPVAFQWKFDENGTLDEDGIPGGEIEHGFIAQEMNEINPNAVTPGFGTQAEHKEWLARDKAHNDVQREIERLQTEHEAAVIAAEGRYEVEPPVLPELPDPVGPEPFQPWQGDWTKLVPDLSAAVQALIRQNRALLARVEELERSR